MLHEKLLNPDSIVVVGASDNLKSPGGKVLHNLITHHFRGQLYGVNPKQDEVQGLKCYRDVSDLPQVDLAIIAIAARFCVEVVKTLTKTKNTKAFIIFSAGFSEQDAQGKALEEEIVALINKAGGTLIGPNNIGVFNTNYAGVFTTPIPTLDPKGVDFISGSGATAVFIIEVAMTKGLTFHSVYSVGNSAQVGVEDVLEHLDATYEHGISSPIKLLYIESVQNPEKFLKHARSLREKGAKLAAIKSGSSDAGSRAASSHTGAIANSDTAVDALFEKAGIIRCHGREDLTNVAGIMTYPEAKGKNIAIVTHAGGPAVMLTDVLSKNGLNVPKLSGQKADKLLEQLFSGSSVANPIDFLATGTAEQLKTIINYCDHDFDEIDAVAVIFGSPGLFDVYEVYDILTDSIKQAKKPIYPILPSVVNVADEIQHFIGQKHFAFTDEVSFGQALAKVTNIELPELVDKQLDDSLRNRLLEIVDGQTGYVSPETIGQLFDAVGIPTVKELVVSSTDEIDNTNLTFPVVAKVVGPVHKTDVGGVRLNIENDGDLKTIFNELMQIPDATGVLIQPMLSGIEVYIGAKREDKFGHTVLCGMGGIMIEVLKDISIGLAPLSKSEIKTMVEQLKAYKVLKGYRSKKGINIEQFIEIVEKVSILVQNLPEIAELDINPLLANEKEIMAVDARIRIG